MGVSERMMAWVAMTAQRDETVMYLFLLALLALAIWRMTVHEHRIARTVVYGALCVGFFATLAISYLLQ